MKTFLKLSVLLFCLSPVFSSVLAQSKAAKKKRVAVFLFDDKTDNGRGWYGQRSVGQGISDMIVTELVQTGKYAVIEREELNKILMEQDLGTSGVVTPESAAQVGKVLGVELAVMGAVTEFGYNRNQTGVRISGTRVGVGLESAVTAVDLRLVNTTTAQILEAETVRRTKRAPSGSFSKGKVSFENEQEFNQSIVGKSAREAVEDIIKLITKNADHIVWSAKVVTRQGDQVFINSGSQDGVAVGETFVVYREGEELIDPDSGLSLGTIDTRVGELKVIDNTVGGGKASICTIVSGSGFERGDVVKEE